MNYRFVETELLHLEAVFRDLSPNPVLPLEWWRQRLKTLASSARLEDHVKRIRRLQETLISIEQAVSTKGAA